MVWIAPNRELIAHLADHPAWAELRKLATEQKERHFRNLLREFELKNHQPDYAELQWERGFWAGMKFLLDKPTLEAAELDRAARRRDREDVT